MTHVGQLACACMHALGLVLRVAPLVCHVVDDYAGREFIIYLHLFEGGMVDDYCMHAG